jgi:hypothetical protein
MLMKAKNSAKRHAVQEAGEHRPIPPDTPSFNVLCLTHWAILAAGLLAGLFAASLVDLIPLDFSNELAKARSLGIVSVTILSGYPKSKDILFYAALILLPVGFSLGSWLLWSKRRRPELAALFVTENLGAPPAINSRKVALLAVSVVIAWLSFNLSGFYAPTSGWMFAGEMGEYLAWANVLLDGGTYARDFFCIYGPLMVYPLAWTMKLLGMSIVVYRIYWYILGLITIAILIAFLHLTIRRQWVFIGAALLCLFISPGPRSALGIVPLLLLYRNLGSGRKLPIAASGFALGISLLFSQEAGLCALIATGAFLFLEARGTGGYRQLMERIGLVAIGCSLAIVPVLTYFYQQDALHAFFESIYGYPKLSTLGYAALPFPHFADLLADPLSNGLYFPYWIIGIYLVAAISLSIPLLLGRGNRDIHFRASVLVYGLFLFRVALGRSDASHYINSSLPAFLLVFLMFDDLVGGVKWSPLRQEPEALLNNATSRNCLLAHFHARVSAFLPRREPGDVKARDRTLPAALRAGRIGAAAALMLSLALVIARTDRFRDDFFGFFDEAREVSSKFTVQEAGVKLPQLDRAGIYFDPETAGTFTKIKNALDRYTKEGEYVLFFPNEAGYYFLFNRRNPTRYAFSYFAVTAEQRREMIADLESRKPAYVVHSLDTYRIDDIPEDFQVPEVANYLRKKYDLAEDLGGILILRRKAS